MSTRKQTAIRKPSAVKLDAIAASPVKKRRRSPRARRDGESSSHCSSSSANERSENASPLKQSSITSHFSVTRTRTRVSTRKQTQVRQSSLKLDGTTTKKRRRSPRRERERETSPSPRPENVSPNCEAVVPKKRRRVLSSASALKDANKVLSPITSSQANSRKSKIVTKKNAQRSSSSQSVRKQVSHGFPHDRELDVEDEEEDGDEKIEDVKSEEASDEPQEEEEGQLTMDFLHRVYDALSTSFVPDELKGREHEHEVIWGFLGEFDNQALG